MLSKELDKYIADHADREPELLAELYRQTHLKVLMPRMLSGNLQGRLLKMIVQMVNAERILEIGTFTGYSALAMAEGLPANGKITTIDRNDELEPFTRPFIEKSSFNHKINYLIGDALELIPELDTVFDLVFIDADKREYIKYYDAVFDKLKSGGIILADNVLWSGKVLLEHDDEYTKGIKAFNNMVQADARVENLILPLRDGIMMARKK